MSGTTRSRSNSDAVARAAPSIPVKKDAPASNRNRIISAIAVLILGGGGVLLGVLNPATHQFFMNAGTLTDAGLGLTIAGSTIGGGSLLGLAFWPRKKAPSTDTPVQSPAPSRKSSTVEPAPAPAPAKHPVVAGVDDLSAPTNPSTAPRPVRTPSPPLPPDSSPVSAPGRLLHLSGPSPLPAPAPVRPMTAPLPISGGATDPSPSSYVGPQAGPSPVPSHLLLSAAPAPFVPPSSPGTGPAAGLSAASGSTPAKTAGFDISSIQLPKRPPMGRQPHTTFIMQSDGRFKVDGTGTCFFYSVALGEKQLSRSTISAVMQDEIYRRGQDLRWEMVQWMRQNANDPKLQECIKEGLRAIYEDRIKKGIDVDQNRANLAQLGRSPLTEKDIEAYLADLSTTNRYATAAEIYAFAQMRQVSISIIHGNSTPNPAVDMEWASAAEEFLPNGHPSKGTIYLLFSNGNHYDLYVPPSQS